MCEEFQRFNTEHVGEDNVFPRRNSAPKILKQFNDKPHTLELPKSLRTIKAMHHHGKLANCKVLEHFVSTTPVVEKCDDPRCF